MDIKNLGTNKTRADRLGGQHQASPATSATGRASTPAQTSQQDDTLELTAVARAFSAAQADAATPPFDSERVQEIRAALAEGRYPIDNHRLADKLMEFEGLLRK